MLKYENKIREIIASNLKKNVSINDINVNDDLRNIGMDSISFITIVLAIEDEFGIEFPNDKLLISDAGTIALLNNIIDTNI
ncbi:MAG: acyl carrier protein [Clostridiales bacterium]|nr:acyl carrier protein [Clostridiales bacterium]